MTPPFGASRDDWMQWMAHGATADLLPCVCEPGLAISPTSHLVGYGKVPSLITSKGVVGLANWTARRSTPVDVARWMQEPRYGICLQTRVVRALDLDLPDSTEAETAANVLAVWTLKTGISFPMRTRRDSTKCLILFRLDGQYPKQVLPTEQGQIEFLANGQQCVVAGTHPDGARYEWLGLDQIPTLTEAQLRDIQSLLEMALGAGAWTEGRESRPRGTQPDADGSGDPVVAWLAARGIPGRGRPTRDGRIHVPCPWKDQHTAGTDPSATTYFPAGTGGYETGRIKCLHAHCVTLTVMDFLWSIGYIQDGFEALPPLREPVVTGEHAGRTQGEIGSDHGETGSDAQAALQALGATTPVATTVSPVAAPRFERHPKTGKIYARLKNVVLALSTPDPYTLMPIVRDTFLDLLCIVERNGRRRPLTDVDYTELALRLHAAGFDPIAHPLLREAVHYVGDQFAVDSAIEWLTGLPPWDGVSRVVHFCTRYLGAENSPYSRAVSLYWWTAHAGRVLEPGIQADMAVVLISGQGTGKTSAIKAIVPSIEQYVELSLAERDDDLARSMRGALIGEIAELRGLSGREAEAVKAWVSRQREVWVPKYLECQRAFPRRLVLVGTSNQEEFLADDTGNRRWLPIRVGRQQDRAAIIRDRDQLWAEAHVLFELGGIQWQGAEQLARAEHGAYEVQDPWESAIRDWLTRRDIAGRCAGDRETLVVLDVLRDALGFEVSRVHVAEQRRVGKILRGLGYAKATVWVDGRQQKVWKKTQGAA